jgi:hypothetical protein
MNQDAMLKEVRQDVKDLHEKLDKALTQMTKNTTDIAWLKKGSFASVFSYLGALAYIKFGGH